MVDTYPLTTQLIEGFLFKFLNDWKSLEEIYSALYQNYGEKVCISSMKSTTGEIKYQHKTSTVLSRGCKNSIYQYDEKTKKYRLL